LVHLNFYRITRLAQNCEAKATLLEASPSNISLSSPKVDYTTSETKPSAV